MMDKLTVIALVVAAFWIFYALATYATRRHR